MALINRQVYVNDGGGRSTSSTKTTPTVQKTTTPKTTTTKTTTPKNTTSNVIPIVNTYKPGASVTTTTPSNAVKEQTAGRTKFVVQNANLAPIQKTTPVENYPTNQARAQQYPFQNTVSSMIASLNTNNNDTGNTGGGRTYTAPAFVDSTPTYSAPVATSNTSTVSQEQKNVDDTVDKIKELLEEQKRQADAYYKTMYEQQLSSDKEEWENARNQINRNYVRTNRYLNNMYGDAISGVGLSNRARNYANWNNNLSENQRNYDNNVASALAQYNNNLANTANTLSQGWYNYVLPIYSNREQNANNMDYQRWAYEQNLNNRRQMNLDDLDYRKYLATLGLR